MTPKTLPVVLEVSALLCHLAVELIDDADNDGVSKSGHQPQVVGTVGCKQTTLRIIQYCDKYEW